MTATFSSATPSATTKIPTFAVGTVVRVQHNTSLFKIHSPSAWSDDDHQTSRRFIHLAAETILAAVRLIGFKEW